jgi:predicted nuclease of predicted toxin-antitoxin system
MTNIYTQLAKALNVAEITDDYKHSNAHDLEIAEWNTADNYDIHIMTSDVYAINFEYDVYYYQPNFSDIIDRIKELNNSDAIVYVSDLEQYLPEYEVENYLEQHEEELQDKHEA